jgi:hypothetical protein
MQPMSRTAAVVGLVAGLAWSLPAFGQNALGDGRALDNNLSTQGRANTTVRDLNAEIRFRNAIVTGNAPNGLSFRGDVGYSGSGEFRGDLGSDELFPFRRDSLTSGLAGAGIRGTAGLQYQFALTTGSRPPQDLIGNYTVGRGGFNVNNETPTGFIPRGANPDATPEIIQRNPDVELDDRGTLLWSLRSPSAYVANDGFHSTILATFRESEHNGRKLGLTASGLRSVRISALEGDPGPTTTPDGRGSRPRSSDSGTNPARMNDQIDRQMNAGGAQQPVDTRQTTQVGGNLGTVHDRVLERLTGREDDDPAVSQRARIELLRKRLTGEAPLAPMPEEGDDAETQDPSMPGGGAGGAGGAGATDAAETGSSVSARERAVRQRMLGLDPKLVEALGGEEKVRALINEDRASGSAYGEQIVTGERLMARGRYFDAEERFAQALSQKPGDVTAQIGRVHAQLGAGLYTSAAVNLRDLLLANPELAGTRYGDSLLPTPARQEAIEADLGRMMEDAPGSTVRRVGALLAAYLGYQTEDRALVERAFGSIETDAAPTGGAATSDVRLAAFLRAIWLKDEGGAQGAEDGGG